MSQCVKFLLTVLLATVLLAGCGGQDTPAEQAEEEAGVEEIAYDETVTVKRVVDGDTVDIRPAVGGIDTVRLIGVDAPDKKELSCVKQVQPYEKEATEFTKNELDGEEVELEFDVHREDSSDRLLAYVYKDDEMFNEKLLEQGYAQVYIVSPNDKYEESLKEAQGEAQAAERRIWGISSSRQAQLADRGNGIGSAEVISLENGCPRKETPAPPPPPPPEQPSDATEDDLPKSAPPQRPWKVAGDPPAAPPQPPAQQSGADCSTGVKNVPVVPGSKGDGNGDGIACES